jgi:MYXO-CTERM domain-containing protein
VVATPLKKSGATSLIPSAPVGALAVVGVLGLVGLRRRRLTPA